jgi:hypothetical protein
MRASGGVSGNNQGRKKREKKEKITKENMNGSGVPSLFAPPALKLPVARGKLRKGASRGLHSRPHQNGGGENNVESRLSMSIHQIR